MTEHRLDLEWELWVIDQLVAGSAPADVVAALADDGLERDHAMAAVTAIAATESFARLRRRTASAAMAAQLVEARRQLAGDARIDRLASVVSGRDSDAISGRDSDAMSGRDADAMSGRDSDRTIDVATFHERYWMASRPVLFEQLARPMRAVRSWSFASLAERFGHVEVEVNHRRDEATRSSDTEQRGTREPLREYLAWAATARSNDRYIVSRNGLLANPALRALWDDVAPLPPLFAPPDRPRGASLWIGPAGTRSAFHFDPHAVMLVQIAGRKRVRLVAPDRLAMFDAMDGYFSTTNVDELPAGSVLETELHAGEALFVPLAWFHEVTALDASITLSLLCFAWPNDFHWLQPR